MWAIVGYSIIYNVSFQKFTRIILIVTFSIGINLMWEFLEYSSDKIFKTDHQKDVIVNNISSYKLDESINNKLVKINNIAKSVLYDKNDKVLTEINNGYLDIGLNDTMKDLFMGLIGAFIFLIFMKNEKVIAKFLIIKL